VRIIKEMRELPRGEMSSAVNFPGNGAILPSMSKKPPLTVVGPGGTGIKPPRPLGQHGMALWCRVNADYSIEDVGGLELLALACSSLDRAEALAGRIANDGEIIYVRGVPRAHPALKEELACKAFVVRTLQRLGLNVTVDQAKPVGRPAAGIGITRQKLRDE
jgi:hypothetical protein